MGLVDTTGLEARIKKGENYLARNPDDVDAKALYWRLTDEYVKLRLDEESRLVVTLSHPNWTNESGSHELRVCIQGQRRDGELDRDDLTLIIDGLKGGRNEKGDGS